MGRRLRCARRGSVLVRELRCRALEGLLGDGAVGSSGARPRARPTVVLSPVRQIPPMASDASGGSCGSGIRDAALPAGESDSRSRGFGDIGGRAATHSGADRRRQSSWSSAPLAREPDRRAARRRREPPFARPSSSYARFRRGVITRDQSRVSRSSPCATEASTRVSSRPRRRRIHTDAKRPIQASRAAPNRRAASVCEAGMGGWRAGSRLGVLMGDRACPVTVQSVPPTSAYFRREAEETGGWLRRGSNSRDRRAGARGG